MKKLFMYGAGIYGTRFLEALKESKENSNWEIVGFLDSNPQKKHTFVDGVEVYGLDELQQLVSDENYTVAITIKEPKKVEKQLKDAGIADVRCYYDFPEWGKYQEKIDAINEINSLKGQLNRRLKQLDTAHQWLMLSAQKRTIESYFKARGIKKIVIYGIAEFGQILFYELQHINNIEVVGFVDKNASENRNFCGLPVYLPEELSTVEDVDMVVVSAIVAYENIVKTVVKIKPEIPVASLENIVKECSIEEAYEYK